MFCASCFAILWYHGVWISEKSKFNYSKTKEHLKWNKKHFSLFCKGSCLDTKQTSKNVADTTFKGIKSILHDQYLLERYPKLGGQSRITYAVATTFIFARFVKDILGVTNLSKKHYNSNINILSIRQWEVFDKKIILKSFIKMLKITTTFLKISLIYFYTGIFLEFCLNFYGLFKAA